MSNTCNWSDIFEINWPAVIDNKRRINSFIFWFAWAKSVINCVVIIRAVSENLGANTRWHKVSMTCGLSGFIKLFDELDTGGCVEDDWSSGIEVGTLSATFEDCISVVDCCDDISVGF